MSEVRLGLEKARTVKASAIVVENPTVGEP